MIELVNWGWIIAVTHIRHWCHEKCIQLNLNLCRRNVALYTGHIQASYKHSVEAVIFFISVLAGNCLCWCTADCWWFPAVLWSQRLCDGLQQPSVCTLHDMLCVCVWWWLFPGHCNLCWRWQNDSQSDHTRYESHWLMDCGLFCGWVWGSWMLLTNMLIALWLYIIVTCSMKGTSHVSHIQL